MLPVNCERCQDTGVVPVDPIFVNTEHGYGIKYRSEEPCPNCMEGAIVAKEGFLGDGRKANDAS